MKTTDEITKKLAELKRQELSLIDGCSFCAALRVNRQVKTLEWVLSGATEIEES